MTQQCDFHNKALDNLQKCTDLLQEWIRSRRTAIITQSSINEMIDNKSTVVDLNMHRLDSNITKVFSDTDRSLLDTVEIINEQTAIIIKLGQTT